MMEPGTPLPKINPVTGKPFPVQVDEKALEKELDPLSFDVLRRAGTEVAFTGRYYESETIGVYKCKACGAELFRSEEKFHSGCGWPSFYAPSEGA
jgi:peptide-methionine (R)-S-oxide reductase